MGHVEINRDKTIKHNHTCNMDPGVYLWRTADDSRDLRPDKSTRVKLLGGISDNRCQGTR